MQGKIYSATLLLLALIGGMLTTSGLPQQPTDLFGSLLVLLLPLLAIATLMFRLFRIRHGQAVSWDNLLENN